MNIEIRENKLIVDGYVNTVCRDSEVLPSPMGNFVEQTTEGMWNEAIRNAENIDFLLNHDYSKKLASTTDGTLELKEDSIGLRAIATITDKEVIEQAKEHGIDGFSFGFKALSDRWEDAKNGLKRRFLDKVDLREVSVLIGKNPAYRGCGVVAIRDNNKELLEHRNLLDTVTINTKKLEEERELQELNKDLELIRLQNELLR